MKGRAGTQGRRTTDEGHRFSAFVLRPPSFVLLVCALVGELLSAQQPSRFRAGIDLVTVDAVVLDKDGNPVPGLTRQDFEVEEDGREQQITEFQSVGLPPA